MTMYIAALLFCIATIVICFGVSFADAAPSAAVSGPALAKAIESAKILPAGQKVIVRVNGAEALVSCYSPSTGTQQDNDCKINAVLIAKHILGGSDALARVKVHFYDSRNPNTTRVVAVTAGDVSAYGSGMTSVSRLLASLEVRKETIKQKPEGLPEPTTQSARQPAQKFEALSSSGLPTDIVNYVQRDTGLRVAYPKGWTLEEKPDKDTLVSFSSAQEDNYVSVQVSSDARLPGSTLAQYARLAEDVWLKPSGAKVYSTTPVLIGKSQDIQALCQSTALDINRKKMKCDLYYFFDGERIFTIRCVANDVGFPEYKPYFNRVLLSIVAPSAAVVQRSPATSAKISSASLHTATAGSGWQVYRLGSFSFRYPEGWEVKEHPNKDTLVKVSGVGPNMHPAEISLNVINDVESLGLVEPHANMYEQVMKEHMKHVGREHGTAGRGNAVDALRDTYSFKINNVDASQQVAFMYADGKIYVLSLITAGWGNSEAHRYFDTLLQGVSL